MSLPEVFWGEGGGGRGGHLCEKIYRPKKLLSNRLLALTHAWMQLWHDGGGWRGVISLFDTHRLFVTLLLCDEQPAMDGVAEEVDG